MADRTRPRYRVPDELRETLLDFTIAYLLERPSSVVDFGLDFFQRLKNGRRGEAESSQQGRAGRQSEGSYGHHGQDDNLNPDAREPSDNGTLPDDGDVTAPPAKRNTEGRRKSVFAESYNPEEDDNDEHPVHPKSDAQREMLTSFAKHILLFRTLETDQLRGVIDAMFQKTVQAEEVVIHQGDDGDNFYVIESGKYKALVETDSAPKVVHTYDGTGSFGELALMYNMPRAATIQAETDGVLWALDRQTFRRVILKNAYNKRKMYSKFLQTLPMLQTLDEYERMNLADALVPKSFSDGAVIIKQGDVADGMYFIEEGEVKVTKSVGGEEKEVSRTSTGGYFGELALLTSKPRAATVIAVGNVKVAFLDVEAFERLLGACMDVMKRNAEDYEQQMMRIFGSKSEMTEIRKT